MEKIFQRELLGIEKFKTILLKSFIYQKSEFAF